MPKMLCTCGETLRWSKIPNPIEWLLISEVQYEGFHGVIDADELYLSMKHLLRCPACGRLWVFWDGFGKPPEEYLRCRPAGS